MQEPDVLFDNENAYRIATVLRTYACPESGELEALIPDIAHAARVSRSSTLYWIDIFESCGFIETIRYEMRQNAICRKTRHIVILIHKKHWQKIHQLYAYMWIQGWERKFMQELNVPTLQLLQKAA